MKSSFRKVSRLCTAAIATVALHCGPAQAERVLGGPCKIKEWGKSIGPLTCALVGSGRYAYVQASPSTSTSTLARSQATPSNAKTSRKNPAPIGTLLKLKDVDNGDIEIRVDSYLANGDAAVKSANSFNDPPPAGSRYGLVRLTLTYHEGKKQTKASPLIAVSISAFGVSAVERKQFDCAAVVPDPFDSNAELLDGGQASGNICFVLPIADATGPLALRVTESFCFSNCDEVWFKLQ